MNKEQILEAIKNLAKSQGFYSRILESIKEDETVLDELANQNFNDVVDLVLFLEQ